jgi:histidinol-phosphate aminotransferase
MPSEGDPLTASAVVSPRGAVRELAPYERETEYCEIELADNTNAFGAPPAAIRALREVSDPVVARYPASYSRELREAIAAYVGVAPEEVCVGCGSGDVLDCAYRAFAEPGDTVSIINPTFTMARIFALTNGLVPRGVSLRENFDANVDDMLARDAPVIYLCSPNNPTGNLLSRSAIDTALARAGGLVIMDEAYAEYAGQSMAAEAPRHGRLLVLRTFSKAFGLAGLRVGYGIAAPPVIEQLEKIRGPFKVTSLGERAALAALREDREWVRQTAIRTGELRDRFSAALRANGFAPLPSAANFLLVPVKQARATAAALRARQIAVRPYSQLPHVGDAIRVSIGPWAVMERVFQALVQTS